MMYSICPPLAIAEAYHYAPARCMSQEYYIYTINIQIKNARHFTFEAALVAQRMIPHRSQRIQLGNPATASAEESGLPFHRETLAQKPKQIFAKQTLEGTCKLEKSTSHHDA
jgi:hypothetical protein